MAAGYEDCNDADFLRIDPSLRLAIGKGDEAGAGRSRISTLENKVLGTEDGLQALEDSLMRSNDALMQRKKKQRLIVDTDSTEDLTYEEWEKVTFNGHFGKNCFHLLFAFTSDGDCLAGQARLLMGFLAYNFVRIFRQFYLMGEDVTRSAEWLIKRLIKVGAKVAYRGRSWQPHVASAFSLAEYYCPVFG